jgi:hypothetical protein
LQVVSTSIVEKKRILDIFQLCNALFTTLLPFVVTKFLEKVSELCNCVIF